MWWRILTHYFCFILANQLKWTKDHDIVFLRQLLLQLLTDISFKFTKRSVQNHYQTLEKTYKKQKRKEGRQGGINPEETEVDFDRYYRAI